jgi:hypothetical protein
LSFFRQLVGDIPGQQFVNAVDLTIGDMGQHMVQIGLRINTVELAWR